MTLPTTRIDTLSPGNGTHHGHEDPTGYSNTNTNSSQNHNGNGAIRNSHEILLVDFVPNDTVTTTNATMTNASASASAASLTHSHHGATTTTPTASTATGTANNILPSNPNVYHGYQIPIQAQVQPHASLNLSNDLSNFTLVNLSNQNETAEPDFNPGDQDESPLSLRNQSHYNSVSSSRNSFSGPGNGNGGLGQRKPFKSRNANASYIPVGEQQEKMSSSFNSSSSDDSDTGFLVPQNGRSLGTDRHYRQRQSSLPVTTGYPGSPIMQQPHRKRLRRKRTSGRKKPINPQEMQASDLFPICCCYGEEQTSHGRNSGSGSSLTSKYLRFSCVIVMLIFVATFASIMVSLQRKVDTLSIQVNKLTVLDESGEAKDSIDESKPLNRTVIQELFTRQDQLNISYTSLKTSIDELGQKISNLEKQPSVEEVRKELARLGSELKGSVGEVKEEIRNLKQSIQSQEKSNSKEKPGRSEAQGGSSQNSATIPSLNTLSS